MRLPLRIAAWCLLASSAAAAAQTQLPPGTAAPDAPATTPANSGPADKARQVTPELAAIEDKLDARQYEAAKASLLHYVEAHPADARALFDLGYLNEAVNQDGASEAAYRRAITTDPQQFEARLALGLMLARQDKSSEAREQLQAATERQPATPNPAAQAQAFRALAQLELATDPADARQALVSALRLSPETSGDLLLTARIAAANGDPQTAEAAYRRLLERQPDSVEGLAGLTHTLLQQKSYAEAEPLLRKALARIPGDPGLNMQMASLLAAEGKQEEATATLEKLHAAAPEDAQVSQMLADADLAAHHPERAEPLLAAMLKQSPDDADLLDEEGQALIFEERFAEAADIFEHAVRLKKADVDAWGGLAFADSRLHRDTEALHALLMRSKLAEDTASTLFLWAISYDNLHQAKLAAEYYKRFLDTAKGKFPDQEWQAHHRLVALGQDH